MNNVEQEKTKSLDQLISVVSQGWKRPFYRTHWGFKHLDDVIDLIHQGNFSDLPTIRKHHIRDYWDEIIDYGDFVDIISSSGTTGRPVDIPLHKQQQLNYIDCIAIALKELGVRAQSRVLSLFSLNDMFTLGPLLWLAARELGAGCIRVSPQRAQRVLSVIKYHKPKFVAGNPAFLVRVAQELGEEWPSCDELPDHAYFAAAPAFDHTMNLIPSAAEAIKLWGLKSFLNEYGSSESGPIGYECRYQQGFHVQNNCYLELINPSTGKSSELNMMGEVVITGLSLPRGFIPIRYATGDISAWMKNDQCLCGRKGLRFGPIVGRVDHQLKLFGQTIYPELLLNIIDGMENVSRSAIVVKRNTKLNDLIEILVVPAYNIDNQSIKKEIETLLSQHLPLLPEIIISTNKDIDKLEHYAMSKTNQVKIPRLFIQDSH